MMLQKNKINQQRNLIKSTLKYLDPHINYSDVSAELVLATGAHEGRNFDFMKQVKGPALSYYQIEPTTHNDNWKNCLLYRPKLAIKFLKLAGENLIFEMLPEDQHEDFIIEYIEEERYKDLEHNLLVNQCYAIAHCRLVYFRKPFKMPKSFNIIEMSEIWKHWYNTTLGKGTPEEFKRNYQNYID